MSIGSTEPASNLLPISVTRTPRRLRFTAAAIVKLVANHIAGDAFVWDANMPGFGLRLQSSGRRVWVVQYRKPDGGQRRQTLGDIRTVHLDEARARARELLAMVSLGHDPQGDRHRARRLPRVSELVTAYLSDAKARRKPRTYVEIERSLNRTASALHHQTIEAVTRRDITNLLSRVKGSSGPVAATRLRAYLSAMFNWGLRSGFYDGTNPVERTLRPAVEKSRDRVLSDGELALIWRCTGGDDAYSRIVRLLLLTGQRRDEVGGMQWGEIANVDGGPLWTLPASRAKNGLPHEIPLTEAAAACLPKRRDELASVFGPEGGYSAWSGGKARLDRRMLAALRSDFAKANGRQPEPGEVSLEPWRLHDLRRTFATWANEAGAEPHIVEAALNHVSGAAKRGVAGVYNRAAYRHQKTELLACWAEHICRLTRSSKC